MDFSNIDKIKSLCSKGYTLNFESAFENAFANYKKIALDAGLLMLLFTFAIIITGAVGVFAYQGNEYLEVIKNIINQIAVFQQKPISESLLIYIVLILFSGLFGPLMAGFYKMANSADINQEFTISTMFSYYKYPYFSSIFFFVMITGIINNTSVILFNSLGISFLGTALSLIISFLTFLSIPLIVFSNLNAFDAIKYSSLIILNKPSVILGLVLISIIICLLGLFGFCIGIFFTYPFIYSMQYMIYKNIVGFDNDNEIAVIGKSQE